MFSRIGLDVDFIELLGSEGDGSLFCIKCSTRWLISDLNVLIFFGLVNVSSSLDFIVWHTIVQGTLMVLGIVHIGDVMSWWWWSTSDKYRTWVRIFFVWWVINVCLINMCSFK